MGPSFVKSFAVSRANTYFRLFV